MALTGTKGLFLWCKQVTESYDNVHVTNMTSSWRDGLAFCAIIHHFRPDVIDYHRLSKENIEENNRLAFTTAEREFGIPALLDVDDMVSMAVPDKLSIMTYVSQYYNYFKDHVPAASTHERHSPPKRPLATKADFQPAKRQAPDSLAIVPGLSAAKEVIGSPPKGSRSGSAHYCAMCGKAVYLMERLNAENKTFHRICFRCSICGCQLRPSQYRYIPSEKKFYCDQHYRSRTVSTGSEDSSESEKPSFSTAVKNLPFGRKTRQDSQTSRSRSTSAAHSALDTTFSQEQEIHGYTQFPTNKYIELHQDQNFDLYGAHCEGSEKKLDTSCKSTGITATGDKVQAKSFLESALTKKLQSEPRPEEVEENQADPSYVSAFTSPGKEGQPTQFENPSYGQEIQLDSSMLRSNDYRPGSGEYVEPRFEDDVPHGLSANPFITNDRRKVQGTHNLPSSKTGRDELSASPRSQSPDVTKSRLETVNTKKKLVLKVKKRKGVDDGASDHSSNGTHTVSDTKQNIKIDKLNGYQSSQIESMEVEDNTYPYVKLKAGKEENENNDKNRDAKITTVAGVDTGGVNSSYHGQSNLKGSASSTVASSTVVSSTAASSTAASLTAASSTAASSTAASSTPASSTAASSTAAASTAASSTVASSTVASSTVASSTAASSTTASSARGEGRNRTTKGSTHEIQNGSPSKITVDKKTDSLEKKKKLVLKVKKGKKDHLASANSGFRSFVREVDNGSTLDDLTKDNTKTFVKHSVVQTDGEVSKEGEKGQKPEDHDSRHRYEIVEPKLSKFTPPRPAQPQILPLESPIVDQSDSEAKPSSQQRRVPPPNRPLPPLHLDNAVQEKNDKNASHIEHRPPSKKLTRAPDPPRPHKEHDRPVNRKKPVVYKSDSSIVSTEERKPSREEMQMELRFIEKKQREMEQRGVTMEKMLREQMQGEPEEEYMIEWFNLVCEKNILLRRENELIYLCQELDYVESQRSVEFELRQLLEKEEHLKTAADKRKEEELLDKLVYFVSKRSNIVDKLDEDRIREKEEDEQIEKVMEEQGLTKEKRQAKRSKSKFYV